MTRKLVVFNDSSWTSSQLRSRKRPVTGNASLAHQCLSSEDDSGIRQISYLMGDSRSETSLRVRINRLLGTGLRQEVLQTYRFLMHNYMDGDEIYLIGAGRGGFALQCLAEMISISGLLHLESFRNLKDAYTYSRLTENARSSLSGQELRSRFKSRDVQIKFLGCWDPVGMYGVPTAFLRPISRLWTEFHRNQVSSNIEAIYQAFALDETNPDFIPNILSGSNARQLDAIEQVWFAGKHSNVTGGQRDSRLSDIALQWLIAKAMEHGLKFKTEKLDDLSTPDPLGCMAEESWVDHLNSKLPKRTLIRSVARADTHFSRQQIPGTEKIHISVKTRERKDSQYQPAALASLPPGSLPISQDDQLPKKFVRKHERLQINCPATLLVSSKRFNGNMLDFSEGGACVWVPLDLPIGTPVTIRSSVAFEKERKGHVVWVRDQSLGLEFSHDINLEDLDPKGHTLQ